MDHFDREINLTRLEIDAQSRGTYGARRIHPQPRDESIRVGRKRVERLMRAVGVSGLIKRKRGRTTISVPGVRIADDLVERDFNPLARDLLWVADIERHEALLNPAVV